MDLVPCGPPWARVSGEPDQAEPAADALKPKP